MAEPPPISPGSYFAELQALQAAHAARLITNEELECQKSQLLEFRRGQGAGVSIPLQGLNYLSHPRECGCGQRGRLGFDHGCSRSSTPSDDKYSQEPSPEDAIRQASLAYVPSSSAAIRALMGSPVGFVHMQEEKDSPVGVEMKNLDEVRNATRISEIKALLICDVCVIFVQEDQFDRDFVVVDQNTDAVKKLEN